MLTIFGIGLVVGVLLVIALLRATMTTDPRGCIAIFGTIILLFFSTLLLIPWFIFFD